MAIFVSDLYQMSSPSPHHPPEEAPVRRRDIYSRISGGPTNNLPVQQAPMLTILRMMGCAIPFIATRLCHKYETILISILISLHIYAYDQLKVCRHAVFIWKISIKLIWEKNPWFGGSSSLNLPPSPEFEFEFYCSSTIIIWLWTQNVSWSPVIVGGDHIVKEVPW